MRPSSPTAEQQPGIAGSPPDPMFFAGARPPHAAHFGDHVRHLRDAEHVQDQRHPAVAHDGRPGEAGEPLQLLAQRLYDDFLGVVDLVHHQAELALVGLASTTILTTCACPVLVSGGAEASRSSRLR